jgi:hypothetical protein
LPKCHQQRGGSTTSLVSDAKREKHNENGVIDKGGGIKPTLGSWFGAQIYKAGGGALYFQVGFTTSFFGFCIEKGVNTATMKFYFTKI